MVFYIGRAEFQRARELGEQLLRLAQRVRDVVLLLVAHTVVGTTLYFLGEFAPAQERLEQGIALYDPPQHRSHAFLYGMDHGMVCRSWTAMILSFLGYPDQALQRSHEALSLVGDLAHPFSMASALLYAAMFHQYRREEHATQERAEALMALSAEQGFQLRVAHGSILLGWALAAQGQGVEMIAEMRQGLAAYQAVGTELARPYYLALLAEAYGEVGQTEAGLTVLAEALAVVDKTGERYWEAELHRLKGELLLALSTDKTTEAEACFRQALDIACRQQAMSLELRAATSLARLWQRQGKRAEARQLLAPVYGWFTEGFDTPDLREAKGLFDALS